MHLYDVLVFVHVASAVALLSGSVIGSPAVRAAVRRARDVHEMRAYLAIGRPLLVLEPIAALAVLGSGVYLSSVAGFWTLGWVQVAVAAWIVNAALAGALVKPAIERVAAAAAASDHRAVAQPLDALRWSGRWSFGGDVLMANDAAILYVMVMQPGVLGSLAVVAAANLVVTGVRAITAGYGSSHRARPIVAAPGHASRA